MALKTPMVMGSDGHPSQLQPTDQLNTPTAATSTRQQKSGESSAACPPGTPVYFASGGFLRSQANAKATATVGGLVYDANGIASGASGYIAVGGVLTLTTAQWDAVVTGQNGGLQPGADYFLDPANLGKLTMTPPSTPGQCNTYVCSAMTTVDMEITPRKPILL